MRGLLGWLLWVLRGRGRWGGGSVSPSRVAFSAARGFYREGLMELGLFFEDVGSVLEEVEELLEYAEYVLGPAASGLPSG